MTGGGAGAVTVRYTGMWVVTVLVKYCSCGTVSVSCWVWVWVKYCVWMLFCTCQKMNTELIMKWTWPYVDFN